MNEECPQGSCKLNPHNQQHKWECSLKEHADICYYCGFYRKPCRHADSTRTFSMSYQHDQLSKMKKESHERKQ